VRLEEGMVDIPVVVRGRRITGAELALTDPAKAIEHPAVDAVVIVTPTNTHAHLIKVAANAGKAVFGEKPIALDLAETRRVGDAPIGASC
jgi:predicted dehydrogenase